MALILPASMRCNSETWRIKMASRSGGQGITGTEQIVASPAGRWIAKASFHLLDEDDAQLDARGFIASLDGQAGTFMIGPTDWRGQPWNIDPLTGAKITPGLAAASAAVDPAYQTNPDTTGTLTFSLAADAPMNATVIRIQRTQGGFIRRGQYLQIGERLHIIVLPPAADPAGGDGRAAPGVIEVAIRPWLRDAYSAGTPINFANPQCLMRFADADQGDIEMTTSPLSDLSFSLTEAF